MHKVCSYYFVLTFRVLRYFIVLKHCDACEVLCSILVVKICKASIEQYRVSY